MMINDGAGYKPKWTITKYAEGQVRERSRLVVLLFAALAALKLVAPRSRYIFGTPYECVEVPGNLLLNEGIGVLQTLLCGTGGTAFSNANARLAVGDSSTAAAATQTGLQASTNKLYKAMEPTYPQISGNVTTWRSVFAGTDANFAWNEFTVANGSSDAATNLNRKVSAQGTKTSGQTWTLDLSITWS